MKYLFARSERQVLRKFASSNTLVALDFDGTLAPIVHDRQRAAIRQSTRPLLGKLAKLYPCVIISGRSRKDVLGRLRGIALKEIIGNHGIEPWSASRTMEKAVRRWLPLLKAKLWEFRGVAIEDKKVSVAIHYRDEPRKQKVRTAIAGVASQLGAVRFVGGNKSSTSFLPERHTRVLPWNARYASWAARRRFTSATMTPTKTSLRFPAAAVS